MSYLTREVLKSYKPSTSNYLSLVSNILPFQRSNFSSAMDRSEKFSIKRRKPSFLKPLVNQHFSTRVQIPRTFVKKYEKYLSSKIVLKNHLNKSWEVEVIKIGTDSYFGNGWKTFIEDNKLEFGDIVVFEYSCNSTFKFKMYGRTCCEKEVENTYEAADADEENQEQLVKYNAGNGERNVIIIDSDNDQAGQLKHSTHKRKRRSRDDAVINFNSPHPFFHVKLTSTYAASYLPIPFTFFREHMKMEDQEIKLEMDKRMWSVNLYINYRKPMKCGEARFTGGWMQFVKENNLKERDVCIFEMIKTDAPYAFRVRIDRL